MSKTIFLHPSLIVTIIIAGLAFALANALNLESNIASIASSVFSVAGTMVALALPAAELMGHLTTRTAEYWLNRVLTANEADQSEHAQRGSEFIGEARQISITAWRGSLYVLFSFCLSSLALFTPTLRMERNVLHIDYALVGAALGFLLVGAYWFFPAALQLYRLETLQHMKSYFDFLVDRKKEHGMEIAGEWERNAGEGE